METDWRRGVHAAVAGPYTDKCTLSNGSPGR